MGKSMLQHFVVYSVMFAIAVFLANMLLKTVISGVVGSEWTAPVIAGIVFFIEIIWEPIDDLDSIIGIG